MASYRSAKKKGFGAEMSFFIKLVGHMNSGNEDRVKDYVLSYFDSESPESFINEFKEAIREMDKENEDYLVSALVWLKERGWKVLFSKKPEHMRNGYPQIGLLNPSGELYHSHYAG